jgi:hypothetical protein
MLLVVLLKQGQHAVYWLFCMFLKYEENKFLFVKIMFRFAPTALADCDKNYFNDGTLANTKIVVNHFMK